MIEGKCPKCGARFFGWALAMPRNQMCDKCGVGLEITQDGKVFKGYSPFEADKFLTIRKNPDSADSKEDADKHTG